jgi:hypothetical protein
MFGAVFVRDRSRAAYDSSCYRCVERRGRSLLTVEVPKALTWSYPGPGQKTRRVRARVFLSTNAYTTGVCLLLALAVDLALNVPVLFFAAFKSISTRTCPPASVGLARVEDLETVIKGRRTRRPLAANDGIWVRHARALVRWGSVPAVCPSWWPCG